MKTTFSNHEANQLAERGFTVMTSMTRTGAKKDGSQVSIHKGLFRIFTPTTDPLGTRLVQWRFKNFLSVLEILDAAASP